MNIIVIFLCLILHNAYAQDLVVVNGGLFGSNEKVNINIQNINSGSFLFLDTIFSNSVQDLLIQDNFLYIAAQDSIVKYNLMSKERVAATSFGAMSTIKMQLYNNKLLVGNWYEPFGFAGNYDNHLRIFDANDLSFQDSIPDLRKPSTDMVILNDTAYIVQNNRTFSGWEDTLGYLAVVDLTTYSLIRNDTLSNSGDEIGRLILEGQTIYTLNSASNTISSLNTHTGNKNTVHSGVDLNANLYGPTIYKYDGKWFFPFNQGIGSFDLINNIVVDSNIINIDLNFAFVLDTLSDRIYVSYIDYWNQQNNKGVCYNMAGDSIASFQVGYSPELLGVYYESSSSNSIQNNDFAEQLKVYPNPFNDQINVELPLFDLYQVRLFSSDGNLVSHKSIYSDQIKINLESLPQGIYYLQLINTQGQLYTSELIRMAP